jgi:predicted anti-sigma-YlaC factor YlaD
MKTRFALFSLVMMMIVLGSCSINRLAIRAVSDALTGEGSSDVFTGDEDPELVGDSIPFAIKLYETLLSNNPDHEGLILTTGSLFIMYANAFVQGPAQLRPNYEFLERQSAFERAKKLYLRGTGILTGGLEKKYPGIGGAYDRGNLGTYLEKMKKADVPLLYWIVAGTLSAYSLDPFDLDLGHKLPELTALINRAYELDPDFNNGAIDDFYVLFYSSVPEGMGGDKSRVDTHFRRALEKSGGLLAGPYVSYAEAVAIPAQDYDTFKTHLETALAINPAEDPANRLVNILAQRKARYLLDNATNYFPDLEIDESWDETWIEEF